MKLAIISSSALKTPPDAYGGLEAFVYDLCKGLSGSKWNTTLYAPVGSKAPNGVKLSETSIAPARGDKAYNTYKDELEDFDIIGDHSHNKWAYLQDIPITGTMHGIQAWSGIPPSNLKHMGITAPPKDYPRLVAISRWQAADTLQRYNVQSKMIHLCIDTDRYVPQYTKTNRVLCMGVMLPHKGHDIAIAASRIATVPVDIAGETEFGTDKAYSDSIYSMSDANILEGCIMWGRVSNDTKIKLLQRSKALLLPFKKEEAWSLLALEALSCGTPVIASDRGAISEIIEHGVNGFLVDTVDPSVWAKYIWKVGDIDTRACRQTVEDKFSIPVIAKQYLQLFDDIIQGDKW